MRLKIVIILAAALLMLSRCEKDVVIAPHPFKSQLTIECILEPHKVPKLFLGKSVAYFDTITSSQDLFAGNASITISSGGVVDELTVNSRFNYYRCQEEFYYEGSLPIEQGRHYHLKIEYDGNIYEADTETNVDAVQIDSISYVSSFSDLYGEHEGVVVSFTDLVNEKNYYRYRMDRTLDSSNTDIGNCAVGPYAATEIGRSIFFDTNIDGAPLKIVIEPAFKHQQGDSARVILQTLDAGSGRFFDDLDRQKGAKVNPFIEPVFITSNIPGCFGIFGACNYSRPVSFIFPE